MNGCIKERKGEMKGGVRREGGWKGGRMNIENTQTDNNRFLCARKVELWPIIFYFSN